jgi:hypothetical protein
VPCLQSCTNPIRRTLHALFVLPMQNLFLPKCQCESTHGRRNVNDHAASKVDHAVLQAKASLAIRYIRIASAAVLIAISLVLTNHQ